MDPVVFVIFVWAAILIGFVAGAAWNAHAYERGYEDGHRDGYNRALGREP